MTWKHKVQKVCERAKPREVRALIHSLRCRYGMNYREIIEYMSWSTGKSKAQCRDIANDCES